MLNDHAWITDFKSGELFSVFLGWIKAHKIPLNSFVLCFICRPGSVMFSTMGQLISTFQDCFPEIFS